MADIKVDQQKFEQMMAQMASMQSTIEALNAKVTETEKKLPSIASTLDEIMRRNREAERAPKIVNLKKISGYNYDKETDTRTEIPLEEGQYRENCCPFCIKEKKASLLDLTASGRWACRTCGKHWYEEAFGQPYSKQLEKFIRVSDEDKDPINIFRKEGQAEDGRVAKLESELAQLKDLIIKGAFAPKVDGVAKVA